MPRETVKRLGPQRVEDATFIVQLGATIHEIRKERGLSTADLAALSGVPSSHLVFIENGSANFGIVEFQSIATALETSIARIARRAERASKIRRPASRRPSPKRRRRYGR